VKEGGAKESTRTMKTKMKVEIEEKAKEEARAEQGSRNGAEKLRSGERV
jgi:hypothetical protein